VYVIQIACCKFRLLISKVGESSGWIKSIDPYGWFQWYCRFYAGRRSEDDLRQITRGLGVMGPTGRWRRQLENICLKTLQGELMSGNLRDSDSDAVEEIARRKSISPKIRQLLLHWGFELTALDLRRAINEII
jgi:hypothetical protein